MRLREDIATSMLARINCRPAPMREGLFCQISQGRTSKRFGLERVLAHTGTESLASSVLMINQTFDTSVSLLERLRENESEAWEEFSVRYVRVLKRWCASWGIQANDIDDIVQETLLVVLAQIRGFEHRGIGSFRAWMKTISWRCWCDVLARAERAKNQLLCMSLRDSPAAYESLEADFDKLAMLELLQSSMAIVKRHVEQKTWQAFHLTAMELLPAAEVAKRLGMQVDAVYAARCRVQRWITKEYKRLDRGAL